MWFKWKNIKRNEDEALHKYLVVHVKIILSQTLLHVFGGLREVFEYDGNVHVNNDEETDDKIGDQVNNGLSRTSAVAIRADFRHVAIAVFFVHQTCQNKVPSRWGRNLEKQNHTPKESLKVEHIVDALRVFDVHEETHSEDGVDEHDEEE